MKVITLTVLFEGTIYTIEKPNTHLHDILYHHCDGVRIKSIDDLKKNPGTTHFKMGFDGCGYQFGIQGLLFGRGLKQQYSEVVQIVKELIKSGNKVKQ